MALSENEQKLANKLKGKILYYKPVDFLDVRAEYVYKINDKGMIVSTEIKSNDIYVLSRNDEFYSKQYEKEVLEDNLDEFKPSFKFKTYNYFSHPIIELYQNDNISLIYDISLNKVDLKKSNNYKELSENEIKEIELSNEVMDKIEKYQTSINAVVEDFHNQLNNKQELIKNVRDRYAYNMVNYQKSEYEYELQEASEDLPIIKEFYEDLKSGLTAEELEEEDRLFNKVYDENLNKNNAEKADLNEYKLQKIEKEKNDVKEKSKYLDKIKKFENKIYIDYSLSNEISKLIYADENGIVNIENGTTCFLNFSHSFLDPANFVLFTEAFSQKDFVGNRLKSNSNFSIGTDFLLYKNDKSALLLNFIDGDYFISIEKNNDEFKKYYKEYPVDETTEQKYIDVLKQFSDIHNVEAYLNNKFDKKVTNDDIEQSIVEAMVKDICNAQGKIAFANIYSSYSEELDSKLLQSFAENWIKKNDITKERIDNLYKKVEAEAKNRMDNYDAQKKLDEQNSIDKKIQNEQKIAEAVDKKLGIKSAQYKNIFDDFDNKTLKPIAKVEVKDLQMADPKKPFKEKLKGLFSFKKKTKEKDNDNFEDIERS